MAPKKEEQSNIQKDRRDSKTGYKKPDKLLVPPAETIKEIEKLIKNQTIEIVQHLNFFSLSEAFNIERQSLAFNINLSLYSKIHQEQGFEKTAREMMLDEFFTKILAKKIAIRLTNVGISPITNQETALRYIQNEANSFYFDTVDEYASYKDPLTKLWSKEAIEKMLKINLMEGKTPIIAYIDLNEFKDINDSYSHETGDTFLRIFAEVSMEIFQATFRESDYFGRRSGDEFIAVFITDGLANNEERKTFEEKIKKTLTKLKNRFIEEISKIEGLENIEDKLISKNPFSAGIYLAEKVVELEKQIPEIEKHIKFLMGIADQALYNAKENKNNITLGAIPVVIMNDVSKLLNL